MVSAGGGVNGSGVSNTVIVTEEIASQKSSVVTLTSKIKVPLVAVEKEGAATLVADKGAVSPVHS